MKVYSNNSKIQFKRTKQLILNVEPGEDKKLHRTTHILISINFFRQDHLLFQMKRQTFSVWHFQNSISFLFDLLNCNL